MNKTQLNYLIGKINIEAEKVQRKFKEDHPTSLTYVEKYEKLDAALSRAGMKLLLEHPSTHKVTRYNPFEGYIEYPTTKTMQANEAKIKEFGEKVQAARDKAIDAANLGDNKDALAILEAFTAELRKIK